MMSDSEQKSDDNNVNRNEEVEILKHNHISHSILLV